MQVLLAAADSIKVRAFPEGEKVVEDEKKNL
jgi:hypothetical protein